jgi:hypothetical protein
LSVKVKHMHLIASCEGMALFMKSARLIEKKISLTEEERKKCGLLLTFAREKFEFALKSITDSVHTLLHLAKVVYFLACYSSGPPSSLSGKDGGAMGHHHHHQGYAGLDLAQRTGGGSSGESQRKGGAGDGGKATTNRRSLLDAALKYYEQAINILKKRDTMAALLASKKSKGGSKGDLLTDNASGSSIKTVGQRKRSEDNERKDKKQIDVNQDLLCKAALEMLTVLCELSVYASAHASASTGGTTVPRERRRIWGSAWDLLQEVLMKYPVKLKREFEAHMAKLMRSHNSAFASQQNECKLYNYLKVGRLGVVIASLMQLESLRIIQERLLQAYYYDLREKERAARELQQRLASEERERLRLEEERRRDEERVRARVEEERRAQERRDELKRLGATFCPLRKSLDMTQQALVRKRSEEVAGTDSAPAVTSISSDRVESLAAGAKARRDDLFADLAVSAPPPDGGTGGDDHYSEEWERGGPAYSADVPLSRAEQRSMSPPLPRLSREKTSLEPQQEDSKADSKQQRKSKLALKKGWRKSMIESTQLKTLSRSGEREQQEDGDDGSPLSKKEKKKKEKKEKKKKMKPKHEEALAQLGLLDKKKKTKKQKKKIKKGHAKKASDGGGTHVTDDKNLDEAEFEEHGALDVSLGEVQLDDAAPRKNESESESDTNSGGSGGSESEGAAAAIVSSPEARGRMGLLKSIQKRRESSELKKAAAKIDTVRRLRAPISSSSGGSSSSSEDNPRAGTQSIPTSHSFDDERSRANSGGASFLPSFGKGRKGTASKKDTGGGMHLSDDSTSTTAASNTTTTTTTTIATASPKGKAARAMTKSIAPTTTTLLFHTPATFLATLDITHDSRSFASAFRERARWRFKDSGDAYPFLFAAFESTFYDPATLISPPAGDGANERDTDREEWERRKPQKRTWRAAEKYLGEDVFLSWSGRYLAAKHDGTVYLSSGNTTRDTRHTTRTTHDTHDTRHTTRTTHDTRARCGAC